MACFTSLPYRDKFYPLLQTIFASITPATDPISFGCYDAASDASKLYQFYLGLVLTTGEETPITENCFVQKTEDQQLFLVNEALSVVFTPVE
jgi:hypothetical protein